MRSFDSDVAQLKREIKEKERLIKVFSYLNKYPDVLPYLEHNYQVEHTLLYTTRPNYLTYKQDYARTRAKLKEMGRGSK